MNRAEYMRELSWQLRKLPKDEYQKAMDYFDEYFNEAGPENEQQAIQDLGTPEDAAKDLFMDLAERLQALRKKAGYSQEQLADLLGISRQAVSKWEASQGKPEIDNIIKLTEIYHVSADYILLGTESAASPAPAKKMPKECEPLQQK